MTLRKFTDEQVRNVTDEETIKEIESPGIFEQLRMCLMLMGNKINSIIKEIVTILENFEDHERKFDA